MIKIISNIVYQQAGSLAPIGGSASERRLGPSPARAPVMPQVSPHALLARLAGIGLLITAGLHASGLSQVAAMADQTQSLRALVPVVWLGISVDLVGLGLIVLVIGWRPGPGARLLLAIAGLPPLGQALLLVRYLGWLPQVALFLVLAGLCLGAAVAPDGSPGTARVTGS